MERIKKIKYWLRVIDSKIDRYNCRCGNLVVVDVPETGSGSTTCDCGTTYSVAGMSTRYNEKMLRQIQSWRDEVAQNKMEA